MKNRFSKMFSVLCVLTLLFALLSGAFSESSEEPVQEMQEPGETILSDEEPQLSGTVADSAESQDEVTEAELPAEEASWTEEPTEEAAVAEVFAAEEPVAEEPAEEEPAAEETETEEPAAEEPVAEEPAAEESVAEEAAAEDPAAAETEEKPAAEPAAEESVYTEAADPEEPAAEEIPELAPGKSLTDTISAGSEYRILLKGSDADTVLLTLILEKGRTVAVRIDGCEAEFTEFETGDSAWSVYTCECSNMAWYDCPVSLSAAEDTWFQLLAEAVLGEAEAQPVTEEEAAEEPVAEEPDEDVPSEEAAVEEEPAEAEPAEEEPAEEETAEETPETEVPAEGAMEITESDQAKLDAGYIRAIVIRQNGTNLYAAQDDHAEAAGILKCGEVVWAKPAGGIWGEVFQDEQSEPLYFNLNNVALQLGEIGYDVPARTVKLTSSLEGMTEIAEGTWIVLTAEFSGFTADEIEGITWQYRSAEDESGAFADIDGADDFTYIYPINAENAHYEWRIILTLKS